MLLSKYENFKYVLAVIGVQTSVKNISVLCFILFYHLKFKIHSYHVKHSSEFTTLSGCLIWVKSYSYQEVLGHCVAQHVLGKHCY